MALNFDLSSIPISSEINKAELFLYNKAYVIEAPNDPPCSLFTIEKEWVDTEFSWNNAKADVPWDNIDNSSGYLGGGDHSIEPVAVSISKGIEQWMTFDITELVKDIVSGNPINGLLFKEILNGSEKDISEGCSFASSEADEIELRPKLIIEYENTPITSNKIINKNNLNISITSNEIRVKKFNKNINEVLFYTLSGKLVKSFSFDNNEITIDKNIFSKGTYFFRFKGRQDNISKITIN